VGNVEGLGTIAEHVRRSHIITTLNQDKNRSIVNEIKTFQELFESIRRRLRKKLHSIFMSPIAQNSSMELMILLIIVKKKKRYSMFLVFRGDKYLEIQSDTIPAK
jgi:hypothetical protein